MSEENQEVTINELIQTQRPPISELVNGLKSGSYFVDASFQRKLVWTERQKARLIETILIGYPMPELYMWQQPANAETGSQKRSVVDGQQRMTTMMQFVANEWRLKSAYLSPEHKTEAFVDCHWKDLGDPIKQKFWDYVANVRVIPSTIDRDTIVSIFKRLNETDKSLNPQEIRNAEFNGELIKAAEYISDFTFWEEHNVFSAGQIRRMSDVEFASSLLIYLRRGSVQENHALLNEMYDLYNDEYTEKESDVAIISDFLKSLEEVIESNPEVKSMLTKPVHIFTLFSVARTLSAKGDNLFENKPSLIGFVKEYENSQSTNRLVAQYKEGALARTRSKSSRDARSKSLAEWLKTYPLG